MSAGFVIQGWSASKWLAASIDCVEEAILVLLNVERPKARLDRFDVVSVCIIEHIKREPFWFIWR